jgi:hypothetical protein
MAVQGGQRQDESREDHQREEHHTVACNHTQCTAMPKVQEQSLLKFVADV